MNNIYLKSLLLLLFLGGLKAGLKAQNFSLIDINKIKNSSPNNEQYSTKNTFAYLDGFYYFSADDGIHGEELWKTDGSPEGTRLVKDLNPVPSSSNIPYVRSITASGGKLYFVAGDNIRGSELWVSDGTEAGTQILANLGPGNGWPPNTLTDVNGTLFVTLTYYDPVLYMNHNEIWKTDGTVAGTELIINFPEGYAMRQMINVNGRAFFVFTSYYAGMELYTSDGTAAGTFMVADINPFGDSYPSFLTSLNGLLYFSADDGSGLGGRLWVSDGTPTGTHAVNNTNNINLPVNSEMLRDTFAIYNNILYFQGITATGGNELCKYDAGATDASVELVKDIVPGINSSYPSFITNTGDRLFFTIGPAGADAQLWKTDGTEKGTELVKNINPGGNNYYYGLTNVDGELLFAFGNNALGTELWKSDGTEGGTVLVKDIASGIYDSYPGYLTYQHGILMFSAFNLETGRELWRSDGTPEGTLLVKNINYRSTGSSYPGQLTAVGNKKLVFTARDEKNGSGLWVTTRSRSGIKLLKNNFYPFNFTKFKNETYFLSYEIDRYILWKTDGTVRGTVILPTPNFLENSNSYISNMLATDNLLYIIVVDYAAAKSILWRTDGSEAGTFVVAELTYYYAWNFTPAGNNLYFTNYDSLNGNELWKTDGTAAGTGLVKDVYPGPGDSYITNLFSFKGKLYFSASDGSGLPGNSFWTSDGTNSGTKLVTLVVVGQVPFAQANGKLFFYGEDRLSQGFELYVTDGTTEGTKFLKDISNGPRSSNIFSMITADTLIYFFADDGEHGEELWKSNGTSAGTTLVKDISPGIGSTLTSIAVSYGDKLFFILNDSLWKTDGTSNGTELVRDRNLEGITGINNLLVANGRLYFTGYSYSSGLELYAGRIGEAFQKTSPFAIPLFLPKPMKEDFAVKLLTNPVVENLQFTVAVNKRQVANIQIIDVTGRVIAANSKPLSKGTNKLSYNTNLWSKGMYFVSIQTSEKFTQVLQVVK